MGKFVAHSTADAIAMTTRQADPSQLLGPYLLPLQTRLGQLLSFLHQIESVLCWHDPSLTTWLLIALLLATALLPFFPWLLVCRACGAIALGPQWYFMGAVLRRSAARDAAAEAATLDRFAAAESGEARKRVVSEEWAKRQNASLASIEAEVRSAHAAPLGQHLARRKEQYEGGERRGTAHLIEWQGARIAQLLSAPDPERSSRHHRSRSRSNF